MIFFIFFFFISIVQMFDKQIIHHSTFSSFFQFCRQSSTYSINQYYGAADIFFEPVVADIFVRYIDIWERKYSMTLFRSIFPPLSKIEMRGYILKKKESWQTSAHRALCVDDKKKNKKTKKKIEIKLSLSSWQYLYGMLRISLSLSLSFLFSSFYCTRERLLVDEDSF